MCIVSDRHGYSEEVNAEVNQTEIELIRWQESDIG